MSMLAGLMLAGLILLVLVALPLVLLAGAFLLFVKIVLLPFKLLGWGIHLGAVLKILFLAAGGVLLVLLCLGMIPLLPLLLLGMGLYLILRPARPTLHPSS